MYKHYPYFRYYHHHFSSDPSPRPGGLRPLSLEGIDGIEQTRTSLLDLLIRAGTRLWSEKTLSGYWFVRNVSWDDLSWEVDSEGDKKPWHDPRDGKDDLAQLQRRETFLRAPAGIRFKVTLSPSAMTVRSFSILLINMGRVGLVDMFWDSWLPVLTQRMSWSESSKMIPDHPTAPDLLLWPLRVLRSFFKSW